MGLDMYLDKRTYVGAHHKHQEVSGFLEITKNGESLPIKFNRISYIEERVAYWRKANHIHQWFVENVQDGEDNCKSYAVSVEQLQELVDTCKNVLANRELAETELPTQGGFFFGATDYDDYYFQDCEETIKMLEELLQEDNSESDFMYRSSW